MQLNGFSNYTKGVLPGNTSGRDFVNIDFKNCVPVNTVPMKPKIETKPTQQNYKMVAGEETDARNFPKINI